MENKPGKLGAITNALNSGGIDIRAFSIADTCEFGIFRIIVREPERAAELLREKGFTAQLSEVIVAVIEDRQGAFDKIVSALSRKNIDIQYLYSFMGEKEPRAQVVIKTGDMEKARRVLSDCGVLLLNDDEI